MDPVSNITTTPPDAIPGPEHYYLCYFPEKKALQFSALPDTWGNAALAGVADEGLADLSWAQYPDYGFLTEASAQARGISPDSMAAAKTLAGQVLLEGEIRAQRDALLNESDKAVVADRWQTYSEMERNAWTNYRSALRDLPASIVDPFHVVWPQSPEFSDASTNDLVSETEENAVEVTQ